MTGKGTEKALLGPVAMGEHDSTGEQPLDLGPKGDQWGGPKEVVIGNPVHLTRGPSDGLIRGKIRTERLAQPFPRAPQGYCDLHRNVVSPLGSARRLEIDGRKFSFPNGWHFCSASSPPKGRNRNL